MKTTILICISLLFSFTVCAQNSDGPNSPVATYKCKQMNPDYNQLPPWVISQTPRICDYNQLPPWCRQERELMSPDGIPALGNATHEKYYADPPVIRYPHSKLIIQDEKPNVMIY